MKISIIKIGNSKGIRIPKPLLEESELGDTVELKVKKGEIKIVAPLSTPRNTKTLNEEFVVSLNSLSDWDTPEEDEAWASLQ